MDLIEYCETILQIKLFDFQKEHLKMIQKLRPNETLIQTPRGYYISKEPPSQ